MPIDSNPEPEQVYIEGTADQPLRVLVTGSAGAVGRCVWRALASRGHDVRGFDIAKTEGLDDAVVADLTDRLAIDRAMADRDTLVHFAAYPNPADFIDTLLEPNVIGLHHVLDAAVVAGVKRILIASTAQTVNGHDYASGPATPDIRKPTNLYALTKIWAEDYGEMIARTQGIEVIAVRISWFIRGQREASRVMDNPRAQAWYVSRRDTQDFFMHAAENPLPEGAGKFHVLFCAGPGLPEFRLHETESAKRLIGFEPRDVFPQGLPFELPA